MRQPCSECFSFIRGECADLKVERICLVVGWWRGSCMNERPSGLSLIPVSVTNHVFSKYCIALFFSFRGPVYIRVTVGDCDATDRLLHTATKQRVCLNTFNPDRSFSGTCTLETSVTWNSRTIFILFVALSVFLL